MSKKKNKGKNKTKSYTKAILDIFRKNPNKRYNYKQVAGQLSVTDKEDRKQIAKTLNRLKQDGTLTELDRGKYKIKSTTSYVTGTMDMTASGAGYVITDAFDEDIQIHSKDMKHALNGDQVKVHVFANKKGQQPRGEVIEVLQRAKTNFVGMVRVSKRFAFLIPDNTKVPVDLYIPLSELNGAKDGEKAIGKITDWPSGATNPFGTITEVLGDPGDNDVEMNSILAEYEFPLSFPKDVEKEAADIPEQLPGKELNKRRDFRNVSTFTIDPVDAKDFDDALSIQKMKNGNWEIGVHIADVTHYVKPGTKLDDEAVSRATSIYLVDRTIPMLPEKLSNKVCSLRPNEDKLCFSAVFEMDENANVKAEWFGRTVINSDRRFTYEQAQEDIETGNGDFAKELAELNRLAKILRNKRFQQGSIAFERGEVRFELDNEGNPLGVYFKEMRDSNQLIEDFMLLANRKVAEFVGKQLKKKTGKDHTFIYRVHDDPSSEKLHQFAQFISKFGYKLKLGGGKETAHAINRLLDQVQGKGEENVVEQLAIRSMAKAVYTTQNIGHYGLAFDYYTHFTSPIRRYPDVMVHRLLQHYLDGGKSASSEKYEELCEHSSDMEKRATEAERASVKYMQAKFLKDKVGEVFEGVISHLTDFGIFVELVENKCEGMIRLRDIDDDFYIFDEDNICIYGQTSGNKYALGDHLKVKVKKVDLDRKQIDLMLAR